MKVMYQKVAVTDVNLYREGTHISLLEMMAVQLALKAFLLRIIGESWVLMSNSNTVVAYL